MTKPKRKADPVKATDKPGAKRTAATIVRGYGTDEEIRARCADEVPGWSDLAPAAQDEMVGLMRRFEDLQDGPEYRVSQSDGDLNIAPKVSVDGDATLDVLRLADALGSRDPALMDVRIADLISYRGGEVGNTNLAQKRLNADLAFIRGGGAENSVQSALLVQMAATHDSAMRAMRAMWNTEWVDQMTAMGNLSTKLLNLYARQAETLAKLQRGGVQEVRHVHIDNRGGQAVITEQVVARGGVYGSEQGQAYGQGTLGPALLGKDAAGFGMPIASDQGPEPLSAPRGSGGVGGA